MKLPILNKNNNQNCFKIDFSGIRRDGESENLYDSVNLTKNDFLATRKGRKPVLLWDSPPEQVLKYGDRVFHRYGNILKEVICDDEGNFAYKKDVISLNNYDVPVKRHIVILEGKICVLPDAISIEEGEDEWIDFSPRNVASVALPFINERTLFYPNSLISTKVCDDAVLLKPGVKIKANWLYDNEFTVVSSETAYAYLDGINRSLVGRRVVLDRPVPKYNTLDSSARIKYCNPKRKNLLNPFYCGYNSIVTFLGNTIWLTPHTDGYDYEFNLNDFFHIGQKVTISGSSLPENNTERKIIDITNTSIVFDKDFTAITENLKNEIIITPVIPNFDHIIFTEDRIFGVDNHMGQFYISMLKSPFVFGDISISPEDPWSVNINDIATGLTLWKDNIICFTETGGFRILGYTALNFGLRQLSVNGLKRGCGNSLVRLGDTLYYCSSRGIMKYSGGSDKKISIPLGENIEIKDATTDGKKIYMLSDERIWIYDTDENIWFSEDSGGATAIYSVSSSRYICGQSALYLTEQGNTAACWRFETNSLQGEAEEIQPICAVFSAKSDSAEFKVYMNIFGNNEEILLGRYAIQGEKTLRLPLKSVWCSRFSLKFEGIGNISPLDLKIQYRRK